MDAMTSRRMLRRDGISPMFSGGGGGSRNSTSSSSRAPVPERFKWPVPVHRHVDGHGAARSGQERRANIASVLGEAPQAKNRRHGVVLAVGRVQRRLGVVAVVE